MPHYRINTPARVVECTPTNQQRPVWGSAGELYLYCNKEVENVTTSVHLIFRVICVQHWSP